jgi:serine phosphatase RsbU (regulator of sigma subunit)
MANVWRGLKPDSRVRGDGLDEEEWSDSRTRPHGLGVRFLMLMTWLPMLLVLADLVIDLIIPGDMAAGYLLVAVPSLAALTMGPGRVAAASVCVLVLEAVWGLRNGAYSDQHQTALHIDTAVVGVLSTTMSWLRRRDERRLSRVRSAVETFHRTLLKPLPVDIGGVYAAGFYQAADRESRLGGDLYDLRDTSYGVRVIVGDVRGKGLGALAAAAAVLGSFREAAHEAPDLSELTARLERRLARDAAAGDSDAEQFVTALLLEFPVGRHELRLLNLGHPAPLLVRDGQVMELASQPRLPLGLGELSQSAAARPTTVPLFPGDLILAHTDGVSEARGADGTFYPLAKRLTGTWASRPDGDPGEIVRFIRQDIIRYAGVVPDDVTLLALTRDESDHGQRPRGDGSESGSERRLLTTRR